MYQKTKTPVPIRVVQGFINKYKAGIDKGVPFNSSLLCLQLSYAGELKVTPYLAVIVILGLLKFETF